MTSMTCPNCRTELLVTLPARTGGRSSHREAAGPHVAAVAAAFKGVTGRLTTAEVRSRYDSHPDAPTLSGKGLGRAMQAIGAKAWRNSETRGWEL